MFIYHKLNNALEPIKEIRREFLEKDIQRLIERNLPLLFGLEFLDTEYPLGNFRIDTLAYDPDTNAFVIIEYKRDKSFAVSDQGMAYLSLLSNNKAEFVLYYNHLKNVNKSIQDFDWEQIRVILVAHSFTAYQLQSLTFKGLPIELWEVSLYEKELVSLHRVEIPPSNASVSKISHDPAYKRVSRDIAVSSVDELLKKIKGDIAKARAEEIMEYCETFDAVSRYTTRDHIVYKTKQAFAKIYPQANQFWVDIRWVDDPDKLLLHHHPVFGHIKVANSLDLSKVKALIQKSYEKVSS